MFGLGNRRRQVERVAAQNDADIIARVARMTLRWDYGIPDPGTVAARNGLAEVHELIRDIRAALVRSPAGRGVLSWATPGAGAIVFGALSGDDAAAEIAQWMRAAQRARDERDRALVRAEAAELNLSDEAIAERNLRGKLQADIDVLQVRLAQATERAEAADELVDDILRCAPESWDGDAAAPSIAVNYVRELEDRLDALRVPRDMHPEGEDGALWPDARNDPDGFAAAACAYRGPDEQVPVTVSAVEIVDGVEVPIGKPRETTTSRAALDLLLHGNMRTHPDDPSACRNALGEISTSADCVIDHTNTEGGQDVDR